MILVLMRLLLTNIALKRLLRHLGSSNLTNTLFSLLSSRSFTLSTCLFALSFLLQLLLLYIYTEGERYYCGFLLFVREMVWRSPSRILGVFSGAVAKKASFFF